MVNPSADHRSIAIYQQDVLGYACRFGEIANQSVDHRAVSWLLFLLGLDNHRDI